MIVGLSEVKKLDKAKLKKFLVDFWLGKQRSGIVWVKRLKKWED